MEILSHSCPMIVQYHYKPVLQYNTIKTKSNRKYYEQNPIYAELNQNFENQVKSIKGNPEITEPIFLLQIPNDRINMWKNINTNLESILQKSPLQNRLQQNLKKSENIIYYKSKFFYRIKPNLN